MRKYMYVRLCMIINTMTIGYFKEICLLKRLNINFKTNFIPKIRTE